jgi:hypothetical protein
VANIFLTRRGSSDDGGVAVAARARAPPLFLPLIVGPLLGDLDRVAAVIVFSPSKAGPFVASMLPLP